MSRRCATSPISIHQRRLSEEDYLFLPKKANRDLSRYIATVSTARIQLSFLSRFYQKIHVQLFFQQYCFYQKSFNFILLSLFHVFMKAISLHRTGKVHCINITNFKTKSSFLSTSTYCRFIKDDLQQFQADSWLFVSSFLYSMIFFYRGF